MRLGELLEKIVDMPEDMLTNIDSVDYDGKSVTFTCSKKKRTKQPTRTSYKELLKQRVENGNFDFSFKDMVYLFEMEMHNSGRPYTSNIPRDTVQIKKVFPNKTSFGEVEYNIVRKYIEIFDSAIATPSYTTPTWGGLVYAMDKVKVALRRDLSISMSKTGMGLSEEVF